MTSIPMLKIVQFAIAVFANIGALSLLPLTAGFSKPGPTAGCIAFFVLNLFMLARLVNAGAGLSILIPLMTGLIPLSMIAVGIFFYGETSSFLRVSLLVGACFLAAAAATQN